MTAHPEPDDQLCVYCVHFTGGLCARPLSNRRSLVNGDFVKKLLCLASNERKPGMTLFSRRQRCGPEGRFFEANENHARVIFNRAKKPLPSKKSARRVHDDA